MKVFLYELYLENDHQTDRNQFKIYEILSWHFGNRTLNLQDQYIGRLEGFLSSCDFVYVPLPEVKVA